MKRKGSFMRDMPEATDGFIVGWNDILGFRDLLERVPVNYLRDEIVPRLTDVKENVVGKALDKVTKCEEVKTIIKRVQIRVISDTLAVLCPIEPPPWAAWVAFFVYSITLHEELFNIGLPLRGAVSCGELCIRDWGVFGAPVARAHKVCEAIDMAACVLLPDAVDYMHAAFSGPGAPPRQALFTEWYDVPMNPPGTTRRSLVQLFSQGFFPAIGATKIGDYAADKFRAHGKPIDTPSVQRKLNNTISFLQWNRWLWEYGTQGNMLKTMQRDGVNRA